MKASLIIFILSLSGIIETAYLIRKRIAMERPFCPMGGDCDKVLTSKYNHLLGPHNDILGLLSYLAIASSSGSLYLGIFSALPLPMLLYVVAASSAVMSLVLIYLQWKVIKAWCFWCLISALTIFLIGAILLLF